VTQVDFYLLPDESAQNRVRFACRLADKAYRLGNRVFIHTESAEQTRQLDDLLWTFQQNSFVPHAVYTAEQRDLPPVLLSHDAEPDAGSQVLINLDAEVPLFFSRFERVAELVNQDDKVRRQGRSRFSFYRERGYALRTHEIKN
jgi:DNA polymerase-3 subunit chi